jgi:hypothetical protein
MRLGAAVLVAVLGIGCACGEGTPIAADGGRDPGIDAAADGGAPRQDAAGADAPAVLGDAAPQELVEEFLTTTNVDLAASTATVDTTPPGLVFGEHWAVDEDVGDGADGAFVTDGVNTIAAGEHAYASLEITHPITVEGDAVLRVEGDATISARVTVNGALRLVVGGALRLATGALLRVSGEAAIDHPGTTTIVVEPSAGIETFVPFGSESMPRGSIDVRTRGGIDLSGYLDPDWSPDAAVRSGSAYVRAYGDIRVLGSGWIGAYGAQGGSVDVRTEGDVEMASRTWFDAGGTGSNMIVRVAGNMTLADAAWMECGPAGRCDVMVEGTLDMGATAFVDTGDGVLSVDVSVGALVMVGSSFIQANDAADGDGALVRVRVAGDAQLTDSFVQGGVGNCRPGGDVQIEVGGDLALVRSCFAGGNVDTSTGCSAAEGGSVTVITGGALAVTSPPSWCGTTGLKAGRGTTDGTTSAMSSVSPVPVGPIDAGLLRSFVLESVAVPTAVPTSVIREADATWILGMGTTGVVEVSPDGETSSFVAIESVAGATLESGFRLRARMEARLLDAARLDRVRIAY